MSSPGPALGQRIEFPSALPTNVAPSATGGSSAATVSGGVTGGAPSYPFSSTPSYPASPTPSYPSDPIPGYTPPPSYGSGVTPGPTATFQGNIQPPATWDPYGTPGTQQPTLFPQDPSFPGMQPSQSGTLETMQRFLQRIGLDYVWMPGTSGTELGINDFDLSATFAVPFLYNTQTPLLVTPGFGLHMWNGPVDDPANPFPVTGFPAQTYDTYLDAAWNPQPTPLLSGELGFRIGVFSDFKKFSGDSIRYQGHGLMVLSLSPSFQVKGGVIYLDREHVKVLPAGGIIWTPNSDVRFEILFPNPKLAKRLTTYGNTDWWLYARGEYGGGSWTIAVPGIDPVPVDYNDFRFGVGLEFDRFSGCKGLFEIGLSFERELYYYGAPQFHPNSTVFLRAGLGY